MPRTGRPTKLTPELTESICGYLEEGMSIRCACVQEDVDVDYRTVMGWLARGRSVSRGKYHDFFHQLTCARATGAAKLEARLFAASLEGESGAARACDIALKTLYREWYGAQRHEVTGADGQPVQHEVSGKDGGPIKTQSVEHRPTEERAAEIAAILRQVGAFDEEEDNDEE